ncbi:hypothetical protein AQS8620_01390 [Aquimixticola soesokkakensis]|uniref:T6SS Phospholipase effector Tle1-like catalytic domain-containing protein n=1 Tax=Aquimixticola soesokkakensis TaxID=1519096 RepID=A0A1Y5SCK0_9RHOB|nr:DUF2235 domain-containing protein [Aquimixticola soesokkakensis]SLN37632.1 hypothetical protein AQS8620_01390 [Aquimixticola soesokkakensis]
MSLLGRFRTALRKGRTVETEQAPAPSGAQGPAQGRANAPHSAVLRGQVTHVVILDGTLSTLEDGQETNAGLTYKLCREVAQKTRAATEPTARLSLRYEAGIQWSGWRNALDVIEGRGINRQIRQVYGALASRYVEGDRIFLFGYSRGAYAVRSLAGMIDRLGLLEAAHATERNVSVLYSHYQSDPDTAVAQEFARSHCHQSVEIEMIGVWDTVSAIGIRAPFLWRLSKAKHRFRSAYLGPHVKRGYHALAYHESRRAYAPVMWQTDPDAVAAGTAPEMVQMWFRGNHGDVGGQLGDWAEGRKLSNAALVWILDKAESAGLPLPFGWRMRFLADPTGPKSPPWRGWAKLFWARKPRVVGADPSEVLHPSLTQRVRRRRGGLAWWRLVRRRLRRWQRKNRSARARSYRATPPRNPYEGQRNKGAGSRIRLRR